MPSHLSARVTLLPSALLRRHTSGARRQARADGTINERGCARGHVAPVQVGDGQPSRKVIAARLMVEPGLAKWTAARILVHEIAASPDEEARNPRLRSAETP